MKMTTPRYETANSTSKLLGYLLFHNNDLLLFILWFLIEMKWKRDSTGTVLQKMQHRNQTVTFFWFWYNRNAIGPLQKVLTLWYTVLACLLVSPDHYVTGFAAFDVRVGCHFNNWKSKTNKGKGQRQSASSTLLDSPSTFTYKFKWVRDWHFFQSSSRLIWKYLSQRLFQIRQVLMKEVLFVPSINELMMFRLFTVRAWVRIDVRR